VDRLGGTVISVVREAASGYTLVRSGLSAVRRLIRERQVDAFVCYAVDRWSRQQNHLGILFDELETASVRLEVVTEQFENTAMGRFVLAARAMVAEIEREKIIERTTRGKAERARSGRLPQGTGKGIYGYRYDPATGRRAIIAEQAAVVQELFTSFAAGASEMALANRLNERGVPTFSGKQWYPATVYHLLQNEAYTGRTVYRRTVARQVCDPKTGSKHRQVLLRDEAEHIPRRS
jgi:site-specific DNA recombinase